MKNPTQILLVEDNPGDARLIMEMLKETKYTDFEITNAKRLDQSLKILEEKQFEAILLDLGLPDSHGLDTFRKVQSHASGLAIVILTGLDDMDTAVQAIQEGAQDYHTKSDMSSELLVRLLKYAMERKKAEKEMKKRISQLQLYNKVTVDRELKMVELKKEVDDLLEKAGMEKKYTKKF